MFWALISGIVLILSGLVLVSPAMAVATIGVNTGLLSIQGIIGIVALILGIWVLLRLIFGRGY